jgi:hypothetical protein
MFDAVLGWLRKRQGHAQQPVATTAGVQLAAASPTENRELARLHMVLRKEFERLATAPGVVPAIRELINLVFPERHDLSKRAAAKALLSADTGERRNYAYIIELDDELVAASVSVTCSPVNEFLSKARVGTYLASLADLASALSKQSADPHTHQRLINVVALELVIDVDTSPDAPKWVHSYITAIPTALLKEFGSNVSKHEALRRLLYDPQLLTQQEIAAIERAGSQREPDVSLTW